MGSLGVSRSHPERPGESKTLRVFLSLNPTPKTLVHLGTIQSRIRDQVDRVNPALATQLRWTKTSQFHLTLLFFGDIPANDAPYIASELAKLPLPTPELTLQKVGCFPLMHRPKVLWLGVTPDQKFQELQRTVIDRFAPEYGLDTAPSYPHLTLARVPSAKKNSGALEFFAADLLRLVEPVLGEEAIAWQPDQVSLMRSDHTSQGVAHQALATVKLGGGSES